MQQYLFKILQYGMRSILKEIYDINIFCSEPTAVSSIVYYFFVF